MKNALLVMAAVSIVFTSIGKPVSRKKFSDLTPTERAEMKERHLLRTGGLVHTGSKGEILYLDFTKQFPQEALDSVSGLFTKNLRIKVNSKKARDGIKFAIRDAETILKDIGANAVVYVVDDQNLPMSIVAMESKWALINLAKINSDKPSKEILQRRGEKLLIRATTVVLGGANSDIQVSAMQSINSLEDLDAVKGRGVDPRSCMAIFRHLPTIGVIQDQITSYRKACEEGWAFAPTNKYQKLVWEQVSKQKKNGK